MNLPVARAGRVAAEQQLPGGLAQHRDPRRLGGPGQRLGVHPGAVEVVVERATRQVAQHDERLRAVHSAQHHDPPRRVHEHAAAAKVLAQLPREDEAVRSAKGRVEISGCGVRRHGEQKAQDRPDDQ